MIENNNEDKILLYGPVNGKALLRSYPELMDEPKFKALSGEELLFSWYVGCKSSPIDPDWSDSVRYKTAASKAFTRPGSESKDKREKYSAGDIPDDVKQAIAKWASMSPDARLVAKRMVQTIMHNFQKLVDVDLDKDFLTVRTIGKGEDKIDVAEVDWTAKKQYIDSAAKISDTLPSLIDQLEKGFGITEVKKGEEKIGSKAIDKFHQLKKEN